MCKFNAQFFRFSFPVNSLNFYSSGKEKNYSCPESTKKKINCTIFLNFMLANLGFWMLFHCSFFSYLLHKIPFIVQPFSLNIAQTISHTHLKAPNIHHPKRSAATFQHALIHRWCVFAFNILFHLRDGPGEKKSAPREQVFYTQNVAPANFFIAFACIIQLQFLSFVLSPPHPHPHNRELSQKL